MYEGNIIRRIRTLGTALVLLMALGCATMDRRDQLDSYNRLYGAGEYERAGLALAVLENAPESVDTDALLPYLQAGVALRYAGAHGESNRCFDKGEAVMKSLMGDTLVGETGQTLGALLINDGITPYAGFIGDGIMVNTYKALNFWQHGDPVSARVEFNRALDRQRRAKAHFSQEIAALRDEMEAQSPAPSRRRRSDSRAAGQGDIQRTLDNPQVEARLRREYAGLYAFTPYPDFINPFTTYMAGLFFLDQGDRAKALTLLKEATGMLPDNPVVAEDFARARGKKGVNGRPQAWIIFENGLGPKLEEMRLDLPLFLVTGRVHYAAIALPRLVLGESAYPRLLIKDAGGEPLGETLELASMDRVIQTEFKKRYPMILTRALVSALMKTAAQYAAQKELGDLGGLAAALFQGMTTSADTRIWTGLPKNFQLARVPVPGDGKLTIETPTGQRTEVTLPKGRNALIYLKTPARGVPFYRDVIPLSEYP